jgi:glycosyltransferase involved in cell wall biosynthesis
LEEITIVKMNILILEWRDIKNPKAGGSEIYFHELANRWVKEGNKVTVISSSWKDCKKEEIIDGIKIMRVGSPKTLYLLAPLTYLRLKEKFEVIIDVENGIPFFTPLFSRNKNIILHIHHIHKDVWFKQLNPLFASIGWFLETQFMPLVYRKKRVITLSESSKTDIENAKIAKVSGIVNPGINFVSYKSYKKESEPAILFLNRIRKYKGLDILLKAIKELKDINIKPKVIVAGDGDYLGEMKKYVNNNQLSNVSFIGRVNENKKKELMQKAWIFVNPSFKEGWGIVNIEANYFGTPVIGSNVSGIKDSIQNKKTGLLFEYGNSHELAEKIKIMITDNKLLEQFSKNARLWAKKFNWDKKAKEYLNLLRT